MSLRTTRLTLEGLGRGSTERLNATREVVEALGHGTTDRAQISRFACEILGTYVFTANLVSAVRAEVLGKGNLDGLHATQVQCEVLGEITVPTIRVTELSVEVLGYASEPGLRISQLQAEVLGEVSQPSIRLTDFAAEILGTAEVFGIRASQVQSEVLGEWHLPTLAVTTLRSEVMGQRRPTRGGGIDLIHVTQIQVEILGEFGSPSLRLTRLTEEVLGDPVDYGQGMIYYGTLSEADSYFASRLHERAWSDADPADRPKALWAATQIIDTLNFKGYKSPVYTLLQEYDLQEIPSALTTCTAPTADELATAEASQELEFPRGSDTEVPLAIRRACFEIAHSLLDGKDPELELENLGIVSQGYASVRTTFSRTHVPVEHIVNGVPSALAWRLLLPFLRDDDAIRVSRVS